MEPTHQPQRWVSDTGTNLLIIATWFGLAGKMSFRMHHLPIKKMSDNNCTFFSLPPALRRSGSMIEDDTLVGAQLNCSPQESISYTCRLINYAMKLVIVARVSRSRLLFVLGG